MEGQESRWPWRPLHSVASPPPSRRTTPLWRATLTAALIAGIGLASAPAQALAAPDQPGTAEEAAALVAERGHALEALTEEFNTAKEGLAAQQAAATAVAAEVSAAQAQLAAARSQLAGLAESAYTGAGMSSLQAFMTSESPENLLDRLSCCSQSLATRTM